MNFETLELAFDLGQVINTVTRTELDRLYLYRGGTIEETDDGKISLVLERNGHFEDTLTIIVEERWIDEYIVSVSVESDALKSQEVRHKLGDETSWIIPDDTDNVAIFEMADGQLSDALLWAVKAGIELKELLQKTPEEIVTGIDHL